MPCRQRATARARLSFGALPKYLPGFRSAGTAASRKLAAKVWGTKLPDKVGLGWPDLPEAIQRGYVKGLYLMGVNPFELGWSKPKVEGLLARLELLIVQDCTRTAACDFAQVVLPASTFVEKTGTDR